MYSLLDSPTSSSEEISTALPISNKTPGEMESSHLNTLSEGRSFIVDNLGECTMLQPQQPQNGNSATVSDLNMKLQDLTRQLEAARIKLDRSEKEHKLTEEKLAATTSELDWLRDSVMNLKPPPDMFDTVPGFVFSNKCRTVDLEHKLKGRCSPDLRPQKEAKAVYDGGEALSAIGSARETDLQVAQLDINTTSTLEKSLIIEKARNRDLEHKLRAETLSVSQLKDESTKTLERLDLLRTDAQSAQQALLDRLDTVLQERLEPIALDNMLQTLVDKQNTALTNVQNELAVAKRDHSLTQKELEQVKERFGATTVEFGA
jgi:hypothetical protein